jgi:hypothetical protein
MEFRRVVFTTPNSRVALDRFHACQTVLAEAIVLNNLTNQGGTFEMQDVYIFIEKVVFFLA